MVKALRSHAGGKGLPEDTHPEDDCLSQHPRRPTTMGMFLSLLCRLLSKLWRLLIQCQWELFQPILPWILPEQCQLCLGNTSEPRLPHKPGLRQSAVSNPQATWRRRRLPWTTLGFEWGPGLGGFPLSGPMDYISGFSDPHREVSVSILGSPLI